MTLPSNEDRLMAAHHLGDAVSSATHNGHPDAALRGTVMAISRALECLGFEVDFDVTPSLKMQLNAKQE